MKQETWFNIRMGLMVLVCLAALAAPFVNSEGLEKIDPDDLRSTLTIGVPLAMVVLPLMMVAVVSFQLINPRSDRSWDRPTHHANPFRFGNPLLFIHFAAFMFLADAVGTILAAGLRHDLLSDAVFSVAGTAGVFIGLRLIMWVCRKRIQAEGAPNTASHGTALSRRP